MGTSSAAGACRGVPVQPVLAAIVGFALLQQAVIFMSSRGAPPCPTLPPTPAAVVALQGDVDAALGAEAKRAHSAAADADAAAREEGGGASSDASVAEAKKQMSELSELGNRNEDQEEIRAQFAAQAKHGKDKFPHAGPNGCVSVREVSKHYCQYMGKKKQKRCAEKSTDCSHLFGCVSCKKGSKQMFPDDITNCMECKEGLVLEDAGYSDCTGTCRPLDEGETPPTTTTPAPVPDISHADVGEYSVPLAADRTGHTAPLPCSRLDFDDSTVAEWKGSNPLMIMITTVVAKPNKEKGLLQDAAAATWSALFPDIITLVAVDTDDQVVPDNLPRIRCPSNQHGTPYVANLFGEAERLARETGAVFAGYTNGDIALDDSLISVLDYVDRGRQYNKSFALGHDGRKIAVLGKRLNIDSAIDNIDELTNLKHIKDKTERRVSMRNKLMRLSRKRRNYWMTDLAEDFFFYQPGAIEWAKIPNYVIGRVGWDSFLTQYLLDRDNAVDVLDASRLIHAAHLTGNDGNAAGWNTKREDKQWNYCALHNTCQFSNDSVVKSMCQECFRCKLGGLHQTPHMLAWLDEAPKGQYYQYDVVPRVSEIEPPSKTRKYAVKTLIKFKVGLKNMHQFISNVDPGKESCAPKPGPNGTQTYEANCCSIMGGAAVEYELGMRWQVRAEWPIGGWYKDW